MKTLLARNGRVAYVERGTGTPLFLLHANGHEQRDFDAVVDVLSQDYRTIAVDWPGCGDSPAPQLPRAASALGWADLLEDIVTAMQIESAVFLGHSVGGFAAARLAFTQPQRVRGLVLVAPGGFAPHTWFTRRFCQIKGNELVTKTVESRFARYYLKRRTPAVTAILAHIAASQRNPASGAVNAAVWRSFADAHHDLRAQASNITAPTLTVLGRYDPVIPPRQVTPALSTLRQNQIVVMDTGHAPFAEDPETFLGVVRPFLQQVVASDVASHT